MSVIRKYEPGEAFRSTADAIRWIEAGRYVFERNKVHHPGWAGSWQLNYLRAVVASGSLRRAVETQDWVRANQRSNAE